VTNRSKTKCIFLEKQQAKRVYYVLFVKFLLMIIFYPVAKLFSIFAALIYETGRCQKAKIGKDQG
jgi:hypothetical protein